MDGSRVLEAERTGLNRSRRAALRGLGGAGLTAAALSLGRPAPARAQDEGGEGRALVEELARRFNEDELDSLGELVTDDMVARWPWPVPGSGPGYVVRAARILKTAFPDAIVTLEELIEDGDRVAARVSTSGTHTGPLFLFPPTGRTVSLSAIFTLRIEGGKIAECTGLVDTLALALQLGNLEEFASLLNPEVVPAATPASGEDAAAAAEAEALLAVDGVAFSLVFGPEGQILAYRSTVDIPQEEVAQAAGFGPAAAAILERAGDAYAAISVLDWTEPRWLLYSGEHWTAAIADNRVVFGQTDALDLAALREAMLGGS
jgi:predicted ester cyclase/roadblock/LC7 domain-containing protein